MSEKRCIIVGGGDFEPSLLPSKGECDLLIAADSGYAALEKMGVLPDLCIGDFDSLGYEPAECPVFRLPVEKDDTDMLAALKHGLALGYRDFRIYAGTGGRFDHTLANIQCLLYLKNHDATGYLVDGTGMILVLQNEAVHLNRKLEGTLSLFALGKEAKGVTIQGMKYTLEDYTLTNDYPIGISNEFIGEEACISVEDGELVCMISYCQ